MKNVNDYMEELKASLNTDVLKVFIKMLDKPKDKYIYDIIEYGLYDNLYSFVRYYAYKYMLDNNINMTSEKLDLLNDCLFSIDNYTTIRYIDIIDIINEIVKGVI